MIRGNRSQRVLAPLRVLHGPVNIGNQPWTLSRAERKLGSGSDLVVRSRTRWEYSADLVLGRQGMNSYLDRARLISFGIASPFKYDVLHYYFGQSFLYWNLDHRKKTHFNSLLYSDLFLAKKMGRKVFMTLQGCDTRLAGEGNRRNEWTMCAPGRCGLYQTCLDSLDYERRWLIDNILPMCDHVFYLNPELGHILPDATFLPYMSIDPETVEPFYSRGSGPIRIIHAPTDDGIKGTPLILECIAKLKQRYDIDLVLVRGVAHQKALEIYKTADLAIDQVLGGWYGGVAVEWMALGKPVACYVRDIDVGFVPPGMLADVPVLRVRPDHLEYDLEKILQRRSELYEIGRRSRAFALKWHNTRSIAQQMLDAYRDPQTAFLQGSLPAS